ncbi:MAG: thiamine-phosphate kinase [Deltaproteobacteria bacterium]|nr:thiamine-phosphate kinase [Deltaproteobacteria bacterium]
MRDVGEVALLEEISRLVRPVHGVAVGPGDDAAVVARSRHPLLLTTDALVEHVHFRRSWLSAWELGWRGFHVAASDVAAMGGRVRAVLLALAAPPSWPVAELRGVVRGVHAAARRAGAALAGGNLAKARELSLTVSVLGEAPARPALRSGARVGDDVWVTGALGGAAFGLRLLLGARSVSAGETARRRWRRPVARLRAGEALAAGGIATAMMDVSDGLAIDAERLARASRRHLAFEAERLPLARCLAGLAPAAARQLALTGGEDYELLFTASPRKRAALARLRLGVAITRIGTVAAGSGVAVVDAAGRPLALSGAPGHEHFRP